MRKSFLMLLILMPLHAVALDAQKISEIKADGDETLWAFLSRLPVSFEAQILYGLIIAGVVGMVASWAWKWSQGLADGFRHFTLRYAIGQMLWVGGISIAAVQTLGFQDSSGQFVGWLYVVWSGAFAGFSGEVKTKAVA